MDVSFTGSCDDSWVFAELVVVTCGVERTCGAALRARRGLVCGFTFPAALVVVSSDARCVLRGRGGIVDESPEPVEDVDGGFWVDDDQELGLVVRDLLLLVLVGISLGGGSVGARPSSGVVRPDGGLLLLTEDDEDGLEALFGSVGGGIDDDDKDVGSGCCGGGDCSGCCCCNSSSDEIQRPEGGIKALVSCRLQCFGCCCSKTSATWRNSCKSFKG